MAQGQQFLPVNVDINKSILKRQTEIAFQFFSYSIYDHTRQKWLKMCCFIHPKSRNGFVEFNASAVMNEHSTFSVALTPFLGFLRSKLQVANEF